MANVLAKGAILTDNLIMQRIWAVTQCAGIDAGMSGTVIRAFRFHAEKQKVKTLLYGKRVDNIPTKSHRDSTDRSIYTRLCYTAFARAVNLLRRKEWLTRSSFKINRGLLK